MINKILCENGNFLIEENNTLESNLVVNNDNESAVMSNVTAIRGAISQSSEQKQSGSFSAKYISSGLVGAHYIYTSTTLGSLYLVSAWVYLPSGQVTTQLTLSTLLGPANQTIDYTRVTNQWIFLRGFLTTTSSAIGIISNASSCLNDYWYVDNLNIQKISLSTAETNYIIEENSFKMECFILFKGEIGQWSMTEDEINFSIVSKLAHWNQRTLYRHPANCRWRVFKDPPCNYSGVESSCDRSYARCLELNNTANFGGFRFLPYLENKDILWGPK